MDDAIYRAGLEMKAAERKAEPARESPAEVLRRLAMSARKCDPFSAYEAMELEAVARELAELRADKVRLDWIDRQRLSVDHRPAECDQFSYWRVYLDGGCWVGNALRTVIDSAMLQQAGPDAATVPSEPRCNRKRSDMTPCVIEDGDCARADNGVCVGCGVMVGETMQAGPDAGGGRADG